jgi:WD40 repeat protein
MAVLPGSPAAGSRGLYVVTGSYDDTVRLWCTADRAHPRPLATLEGHTGDVFSVAFAPGEATLATGGDDHTVRLWALRRPAATPAGLRSHPARSVSARRSGPRHEVIVALCGKKKRFVETCGGVVDVAVQGRGDRSMAKTRHCDL